MPHENDRRDRKKGQKNRQTRGARKEAGKQTNNPSPTHKINNSKHGKQGHRKAERGSRQTAVKTENRQTEKQADEHMSSRVIPSLGRQTNITSARTHTHTHTEEEGIGKTRRKRGEQTYRLLRT